MRIYHEVALPFLPENFNYFFLHKHIFSKLKYCAFSATKKEKNAN